MKTLAYARPLRATQRYEDPGLCEVSAGYAEV